MQPVRRYRGPADAIRIGHSHRPLHDLYFELMRGSWSWLVSMFAAVYVAANLLFATLYWFDPMAVDIEGRLSFADAFFFSVQTLSTIGYGALSPASRYADVLVTIESLVGILGVAVGTGIIFTKFARTRAGVMFSDKVLINVRNQKPCLMLRVANARGNEVVEAELRLSILLKETTTEDVTMRRMVDLALVRNNSPIFSLSWTVMHVIDETSPLFRMSLTELAEQRSIVVVTMTGIDDTFSDTVHARKVYTIDEVRLGERFVDVIDFEGDFLRIDLRAFHDTEPDPVWPQGLQDQTFFSPESAAFLPDSAG